MDRRQFSSVRAGSLAALVLFADSRAYALSLADLTDTEASQGPKSALEKGALGAISLLRSKDESNIEQYVTGKTLDGLYFMLGAEEKKIRRDPAGSGSSLLKKVFGVLK